MSTMMQTHGKYDIPRYIQISLVGWSHIHTLLQPTSGCAWLRAAQPVCFPTLLLSSRTSNSEFTNLPKVCLVSSFTMQETQDCKKKYIFWKTRLLAMPFIALCSDHGHAALIRFCLVQNGLPAPLAAGWLIGRYFTLMLYFHVFLLSIPFGISLHLLRDPSNCSFSVSAEESSVSASPAVSWILMGFNGATGASSCNLRFHALYHFKNEITLHINTRCYKHHQQLSGFDFLFSLLTSP